MNIKPSLCCISLNLQKKNLKSSTMTKKRFFLFEREESLEILSKRVLNNIYVLRQTLLYCIENNWNYRIGSNIFPLLTLPEAELSYDILPDYNLIMERIYQCKDIIASNDIRCSMHPDQFVVPASFNTTVSQKSVDELIAHADFMDMLGLPQSYDAPINIHMNCYKGDLNEISDRFISVYESLPHNVKSRLVLENEDKPNSWSVGELYEKIYSATKIPITYDNLHFRCNPKNLDAIEALEMCISTWGKFTPLFHFSDNNPESRNIRAHGDYVREVPAEYSLNYNYHLDFEFKAKDLAILDFQQRF